MKGRKRRSNGEGSICRLKDGRYIARYYALMPDGTKKRQAITKRTYKEAMEAMRREQELAAMGAPVVRCNEKLSDYLRYWLRDIAPTRLRPSTVVTYESMTRNYIIPTLGYYRLGSLKPSLIQDVINRFHANGCSARRCEMIKNTLSSALTAAVKRELIPSNVARLVDVPRSEQKEKNLWTIEQINYFLENIKDHRFYPIFLLYFSYGMRRGEALGLRWRDIDFENKTIHIRQQVTQINSRIEIGDLKTNASKRELPLMEHIEIALKSQKRINNPYDLIFVSSLNTPIRPNNLYRAFCKLQQDLGLPHLKIHDTRHAAATLLKDLGVPIKDTQVILGHASITTTIQHYQHSNLENKKQALESLAEKFTF